MASSAEMTAMPYKYAPLPTSASIRLLRRLPVAPDGTLRFSLKAYDLKASPKYHCLSYTWGNPHADGAPWHTRFQTLEAEYAPDQLQRILIDDKAIMIRRNLHEGLCQVPSNAWAMRLNAGTGPNGMAFLHALASNGSMYLLREAVASGADVNIRDRNGGTPLHYAAFNGHLDAIKCLVGAGANCSASDRAGETPAGCARRNDHTEIVDYLHRYLRNEEVDLEVLRNRESYVAVGDLIWIDAICINQDDPKERSAQVAMMDTIFQSASFVLAWLGRADELTGTALHAIRTVSDNRKRFLSSGIQPFRNYPKSKYDEVGLPYVSKKEWDAIAALLARQWYRRCWVIQEVVFAKVLLMYCGRHEIPERDLTGLLAVLKHRSDPTTAPARYGIQGNAGTQVHYYLDQLLTYREFSSPKHVDIRKGLFHELNLVQMAMAFRATDPRDKIYALSAMAKFSPGAVQRPSPDYTLSVEKCYARHTKFTIDLTRGLVMLNFINSSRKKTPGLPSWTPDYSDDVCASLNTACYHASGKSSHLVPQDGLTWDLLAVMGIEFDDIDFAASPGLGGRTPESMDFDATWLELISKMDSRYHTGQGRTEAFWRTLCIDQDEQQKSPAPDDFAVLFKRIVCALLCRDADVEYQQYLRRKEGTRRVEQVLQQMIASVMLSAPNTNGPRDFAVREEDLVHEMPDRSLDAAIFDAVRPALQLLRNIAAVDKEQCCTPTLGEVEEYLAENNLPVVPETFNLNELFAYIWQDRLMPFAKMHKFYGHRRPFLTRRNYVGLGPLSLKKGDIVFLLQGADSPFVLRPSGSRGSSKRAYRLIGQAYVHGIMKGEACKPGAWEKIMLD